MMSRSYTLATTVSYLETMLEVMGEGPSVVADFSCRESLRERFRKVVRVFKRFKAEHDAGQQTWSVLAASHHQASLLPNRAPMIVGAGLAPQPLNVFTRPAKPVGGEPLSGTWGDFHSPARYVGRINDLPAPAPFFAKAQVAALDIAIRMGIDGMTAVYAAVMDLWARRHDFLKSDSAINQTPRRRRALDRLFLALMRFVLGFFGSHKVDARNNP